MQKSYQQHANDQTENTDNFCKVFSNAPEYSKYTNYDFSPEWTKDDYPPALNVSQSYSKPEKKPTDHRIEYVKSLHHGAKLQPMVDFDNHDTETANSTHLNKRIKDVSELISSMNVKLSYLKSGTTGHTFKAISKIDKNVMFAVKVCAYPLDSYGHITDMGRPENAELLVLKLLSYFVVHRLTPHFVLPIYTFNTSIKNFLKVPKRDLDLNDKKNTQYKKFINKYHNGLFDNLVSVLISEWCNGGDLLDYIRKNWKSMTLRTWIIIFFQILFTLALVHQKYPTFRHNDMKANNILVQLSNIQSQKRYRYNIENTKFIIPDIGMQIKIWDFDFACIDGYIENNKVNSDWTRKMNITKRMNRYYDMHYFFNTLINEKFFPHFYDGAPREIIEFVHRIIPKECRVGGSYVNAKGRIQHDQEYTTPYNVIMYDPLFEKYRFRDV